MPSLVLSDTILIGMVARKEIHCAGKNKRFLHSVMSRKLPTIAWSLCSFSSVAQIGENIAALNCLKFGQEERQTIDEIVPS